MKKLLLVFAALTSLQLPLISQCTENPQPKVLLVGDSWAFFMSVDQTLNTVFRRWGHSDCTFYTNVILSENGAETDDFLTPEKQDEIVARLNEFPSIEYVHLSIGGNDALGDWDVNFTQGQTDTLLNNISNRLIAVVNFIRNAKPGIKIFWSGYVYPNFNEVIETADPFQTSHPFYGTWAGMGQPSFLQLNTILNTFTDRAITYADTADYFKYVPCSGLLQYTFGQNEPLGVAPGGSYPAFTQPLPHGDPAYPSPKNSMRDYGITKDCFHLSPQGYIDFISYHTQKFYHKALMKDYYALATGNSESGSVSTAGLVSDTLYMGNQDGVDYSTLLSFNLATMPDTGVAKASLFLRRQSLAGANPISGNLSVKLKAGYFGNSTIVEAADITAQATIEDAPCLFGSNGGDGQWIRLDLPASFTPYIQAGNTVQFIVSAPGVSGGLVTFSNSADEDFAPVLDITYGEKTVSVAETAATTQVSVYPNPTNGLLTIDSKNTFTLAQLFDMPGRLMQQSNLSNNIIDISHLPAGVYMLKLTGPTGSVNKRVVKN